MKNKSNSFCYIRSTGFVLLTTFCLAAVASAADYEYIENLEGKGKGVGLNAHTEYWTSERFRNAKELPLPQPAGGFLMQLEMDVTSLMSGGAIGAFEEGHPPTAGIRPDKTSRLFAPNKNAEADTGLETFSDLETIPQDAGTFNAHYTSSRLIPLAADRQYPYRTVGKLFFTVPSGTGISPGDYVCSASVIKARLILTAGHCVHSGQNGGSGWFTNFRFVPAYRDGAAPFQSWNWRSAAVTGTWSSGGGGVPNAADYAIIVLQDRVVNGAVRKIGQVTGWLGWQTGSLLPNHAHLLGYPGNIDSGEKMRQITAGSHRAVSPNNVEYGSNMGGGSSGGPWVQNFGVDGAGEPRGRNSGRNRVVGVTSYGYISTDPKVQGSSILDQRFIDLLNLACGLNAGNC